MFKVEYTKRFKKDVLHCQRRGLDISELQKAANILAETGSLPERYRPH